MSDPFREDPFEETVEELRAKLDRAHKLIDKVNSYATAQLFPGHNPNEVTLPELIRALKAYYREGK